MYGINKEDIKQIDKKIDYQKEYIKKYVLSFGSDEDELHSVYSANLNPKKYFAEINNRVNTLVNNAKDLGYKPVFITITCPSKYHQKTKNGTFQYSPNETAKELTQIWNKFTNLQVFQRLRKDTGSSLLYFRVYEPHKSGVPHLHAMIFLPTNFIIEVKKVFYSYFTNKNKWGANIGGIGFRYTWYKEKGGAVGYVMKYILKTFKDSNSKEVQHAVYWYSKHRVIRFLSSRTLVPLSVYRKVRYYFKKTYGIDDLKAITRLFRNGLIKRYFDNTLILFLAPDPQTGELEEYIIWQKQPELIKNKKQIFSDTISLNYQKPQVIQYSKIDYDFIFKYIPNKSNSFNGFIIIPSKLTNYQLITYFNKLDTAPIDDIDMVHYQLTKNEMIERKLINDDIQSLNHFTNINF